MPPLTNPGGARHGGGAALTDPAMVAVPPLRARAGPAMAAVLPLTALRRGPPWRPCGPAPPGAAGGKRRAREIVRAAMAAASEEQQMLAQVPSGAGGRGHERPPGLWGFGPRPVRHCLSLVPAEAEGGGSLHSRVPVRGGGGGQGRAVQQTEHRSHLGHHLPPVRYRCLTCSLLVFLVTCVTAAAHGCSAGFQK